jgi:putative transposase
MVYLIYIYYNGYTSKTCGCCGKINKSLGSKKTFACPNCKFTIDRDINGARNIMLKVLTCQG